MAVSKTRLAATRTDLLAVLTRHSSVTAAVGFVFLVALAFAGAAAVLQPGGSPSPSKRLTAMATATSQPADSASQSSADSLAPDFTAEPSAGPTRRAVRIMCTPTTATPPPAPTASKAPAPTPTRAPSSRPSTAPTAKPSAAASHALAVVMSAVAKTFSLCVPVLEYHRIVPSSEAGDSIPGLVMAPDNFSAQMSALQTAGWHTITLATLGDDLIAGRTPPARSFIVSIDDGWYDGYKYALPILEAHGFVATFFVISSRIGATDFLSAANLKEMIAAGNEIGDHTVDHVSLLYLSKAQMVNEVDFASSKIAQVTGIRPKSFAYPLGGIDPTAMGVVAACPGMEIAVTEQREIGETNAGRFDVPRLEIGPAVSPQLLLTWIAG